MARFTAQHMDRSNLVYSQTFKESTPERFTTLYDAHFHISNALFLHVYDEKVTQHNWRRPMRKKTSPELLRGSSASNITHLASKCHMRAVIKEFSPWQPHTQKSPRRHSQSFSPNQALSFSSGSVPTILSNNFSAPTQTFAVFLSLSSIKLGNNASLNASLASRGSNEGK